MPSRSVGLARYLWGVGASLVTLIVGAWLILAPFALGYQPYGADWVSQTTNDFWVGIVVVVLSLVSLGLFASSLMGSLRASGVIQAPGAQSSRSGRLPWGASPGPLRLLGADYGNPGERPCRGPGGAAPRAGKPQRAFEWTGQPGRQEGRSVSRLVSPGIYVLTVALHRRGLAGWLALHHADAARRRRLDLVDDQQRRRGRRPDRRLCSAAS